MAIARELREIASALSASGWTFEMLVVDDGSTDATAALAESCGVQVLRTGRRQGYGRALQAGIAQARFDWILISDADGSYPPRAIPDLLAFADGTRMVVGARMGANVNTPWVRRPAKWLLRQYAMLVSLRHIPDLNSGLRLFEKAAAKAFWELYPPGFSFTTTITLAMLATGMDVRYVKIDYHRRVGESKIRPVDFFRMLWLITKLGIRFRPLRLLIPAGIVVLLAGRPPAVFAGAVLWIIGLWLERKARMTRRLTV